MSLDFEFLCKEGFTSEHPSRFDGVFGDLSGVAGSGCRMWAEEGFEALGGLTQTQTLDQIYLPSAESLYVARSHKDQYWIGPKPFLQSILKPVVI